MSRIVFLLVILLALTACTSSGEWTNFEDVSGLTPIGASQIVEDDKGNLWFAASGLYRYEKNTDQWTLFSIPHFNSSYAKAIAIGREDDIWYGTRENGVGRFLFNENRWLIYSTDDGLVNNDIRAIFLDSTGKIWVGTGGSGLMISEDYGDSWQKVIVEAGFSDFNVNQIFEDSRNDIWVASNSALFYYQPDLDQWTTYSDGGTRFNTEEDDWLTSSLEEVVLEKDFILSIYEDQIGIMWFGTMFAGISIYNPYQDLWNHMEVEPFIDINVTAINGDKEGNIWFGFSDGIIRYHPVTQEWELFDKEDGYSNSVVNDILFDSEGNLWSATLLGELYRYTPN